MVEQLDERVRQLFACEMELGRDPPPEAENVVDNRPGYREVCAGVRFGWFKLRERHSNTSEEPLYIGYPRPRIRVKEVTPLARWSSVLTNS